VGLQYQISPILEQKYGNYGQNLYEEYVAFIPRVFMKLKMYSHQYGWITLTCFPDAESLLTLYNSFERRIPV
jgi:hypothetical protein